MTPRRSQRWFNWSVAGAVLLAGIVAVMLLGPPGLQRTRQMDERRLEDLARIAAAVELHYTRAGSLPADLRVLADAPGTDLELDDAATGHAYEYAQTGDASYRLCAQFATDSAREARTRYVPPPEWAHGSGHQCFERAVTRD